MGIQIPEKAPARYAPCSWSELREMADSGLVHIGSHTVTHPILSSVTDEESWRELTDSRTQIEEHVGRTVNMFCFPNGTPEDYRLAQVRQVKDAGYAGAVVTRFGLAANGSDPYQLPRMGIGRRFDPLLFAKCLDGADYYSVKLQSILGGKDC
jgi:peptidoglycan/xylan/chitin deacetylase (PgdA/CDA1 family)